MSGSAARGSPAADPLRCVGCAKPFGSKVPFCPFCGVPQHPEPTPLPAPKRAQPQPIPLVPTVTAKPMAVVTPPAEPAVQPPPAPPPVAPVRVRPKRRSSWWLWLFALLVVASVAVLNDHSQPVSAGLIVRVHGPNGALVQGGQVLVNNRLAGVPGETLAVPPGTVTVSLAKPGWAADARTVSIAGRASVTVDLTARELPAHLTLTTNPPGATVTFAGRNHGKTPFSADLDPGSYEITVSLSGYVGKVVTLNAVHGEPATISIELTPAPPRQIAAPFDRGVIAAETALAAAPTTPADTVAVLDPGTEVQVQAKVLSDPAWLQVRAGSLTGYVPATGSVEPWQSWAQRNTVSGPVEAVTPDLRVIINGAAYRLAGVQPPTGNSPGLATMDAALLDTIRGLTLRCVPHDTASFGCLTPEGRDVAQLYLLNGAAVVTDGTPPRYAEAQRTAREQRRGIWAQ